MNENTTKEELEQKSSQKGDVPKERRKARRGGTYISEKARSKATLLPKRSSVHKSQSRKRNSLTVNAEDFGSQTVNFSNFALIPDGHEKLFLSFYFMLVPYLTGLLFLFIFVAHSSITNFTSLDLTTFFIVWAIGYEIVASTILIIIFYSAFTFKKRTTLVRLETRKEWNNPAFPRVYRLS